MARSDVITLSRADAEISDFRCEAPSFTSQVKNPSIFVPVTPELFKQQRYDEALRIACDELSAQGIRNFIHYDWGTNSRTVETFDQPAVYIPVINHTTSSIELREHDLCETR